MTRTKKLVIISLFVSQAIVLSIFERMIPINFAVPGAKLGLANIVTIISIYIFGLRETILIVLLRTFMASVFGGTFLTFLYSVSGALISLVVMYLLKKIPKEEFTIVGISVFGSISHNIGQVIMAVLIIKNINIALYLPVLIIISIPTGLFVGYSSKKMLKYLSKTKFLRTCII
ncbi:heptaprenyl diphosphate synthase [Halanaerobium saccharolyticum]|uniref:Heptaprenyl diphosphate synthase n=1 Tax=Halanaerobium saccharolyticum TaxID=43595 RepID=A0A4R7YWK6_9FIRM|nr:Gx transporter family protein [Halanaerobium saccharolyticum]RAK06960.1 heptaprenyl diphosphate synthase [Halanaerobium saccharolyticum]TDW01687.1 heptaprenyl diphosphate synthase [Halanaerobium saccharolyticum]TDX53085.1 heptaprenyl diphosphate synthase [Halanaerobium saccharolyticum]